MTWLIGSVLGCSAALYIQLGSGTFLMKYGIFLVAFLVGASSCALLITRLDYLFVVVVYLILFSSLVLE